MTEYIKVADTRTTPPGSITVVSGLHFLDICLANVDGKYYAVSSVCTHIGGPLSKGVIRGKRVVCPWHNAHFNLEDGKCFFPARRRLETFDVKTEGTNVYIRVPSSLRDSRG